MQETQETRFCPWIGRSPGVGNGNPLQYYCLENPIDRGPWQATVYGIAKSQIWLSTRSFPLSNGRECSCFAQQRKPMTKQKDNLLWEMGKNMLFIYFSPCIYKYSCCSVAQWCPTLCDPMDCSMPVFPVLHHLPEFTQIHGIQSSHPLIPFCSCLQFFPASGSFPLNQLFTSGGQVLEFQLQYQSFQWIFRVDFL